MFKLKIGYLISGIITGLILIFTFLFTLPDGKLNLVFCDVGQGDSAYIRFPDGRDMLIDGGPNNAVLGCLGRHMPFWDREITIVAMTHPQKDHMQGLLAVLERYQVKYLVRSDAGNSSEGYQELLSIIQRKNIPVRYAVRGDHIRLDRVTLSFVWPSQELVEGQKARELSESESLGKSVLGSSVSKNLNDFSLVFLLSYGTFDALFTGDADTRVEAGYRGDALALNNIEVLKVPHHGSKTGMSEEFLDWVKPKLAVISVGKNSYGHPSPGVLDLLQRKGVEIMRTDEVGDIEAVSDGKTWNFQKKLLLDKEKAL